MENKFIKSMKAEENKTFTENSMEAIKSTNSSLVDLFGSMGALRGRDKNEIEKLFIAAMDEDKLLSLKTLFYTRDIRGGLGERETSKIIFNYLGNNYPDLIIKNLELIPHFGRWDDLYSLINTEAEEDMWKLIKETLDKDIQSMKENKEVSLLAKWLKSSNASSEETKRLGRLTAEKLGMNAGTYRKTLSALREYIKVTEVYMSNNKWSEINYSAVPSIAMRNYRNSFANRDRDRFEEFIGKVSSGEEKINSGTLYPYNIMEAYGLDFSYENMFVEKLDRVLEEQWKALPNYVEGENNLLIMADTSGSMMGRPISTSVGLAIYFAERNKGAFKDTFMTFSEEPSLVTLKGETLYDKVKCVPSIVANTDIEKAFDLILETSINNNVPKEDMPKALIIISDMEFDAIHEGYNGWNPIIPWTFYGEVKERFNKAGYEIPNIVFWNVDSRQDLFHAFSGYKGVQMASGQSTATFRQILENLNKTPYEAMMSVLNREEYNCVLV